MAVPFKQYVRNKRMVSPEENYSRGIKYTSAPLDVGYARLLVNFDYKEQGIILIPRPGLRPSEYANTADTTAIALTENMMLIAGRDCTELDTINVKQVLLGNPVSKDLYVHTIEQPTTTLYNGVPTNHYHVCKLTDALEYTQFMNPTEGVIHGLTVPTPSKMAKHVGTFAYNNSYYYFTNLGLAHTKFVTAAYAVERVTPRAITPKEAVMWGYNMLSPAPYTFANVINATPTIIQLEGALPYDTSGALELSPTQNQSLTFECFIQATLGRTYTFKWEWRAPAASDWNLLFTETITLAANSKVRLSWSSPGQDIILKLTATNTTDALDLKVLTVGLNFSRNAAGNASNSKQIVYDLKQSQCMAYWKNRLILAQGNNLFISEVNDPAYFPYPNNMEPFDERIIEVLPLLDTLLVFTTTKLIAMNLAPDGLSWYVKTIQNNLNITPSDVHLIQVVKGMVFFKSGNYYYMVVPRAGVTGELTIAPISKDLELFFNNFKEAVASIVDKLYDYHGTLTLIQYYNYLDFEDVHNTYVFQTASGVYLNFTLLYNTVLRSWRIYVNESKSKLTPYQADATKKGTFMELVADSAYTHIQFLKYNPASNADTYITNSGLATMTYKNYQLLDTGYRELGSDLKKRYREVQLKFNNISQEQLYFYTEFYIDGDARRTLAKYVEHHITDPLDPNFGLLTLERQLVDPSILPGSTILATTDQDVNLWSLDVSRFPETMFWKVRVPISGKGYAPRMIFISYNEKPFELLNNSWVARQLNAR